MKLWHPGRIEDQRAVLKLAVADRLQYTRETDYRTANFLIPFKMLGGMKMQNSEVVEPTQNRLSLLFEAKGIPVTKPPSFML